MVLLELRRSPDDRRLYVLDGVGTLRFDGGFRRARYEVGGYEWRFGRRPWRSQTIEATDAAGKNVGIFQQRFLRSGGMLRWAARQYTVRASGWMHERFELSDDERRLAILDGKGWGRRPVRLAVDDLTQIESGLLLFSAYIAYLLVGESNSIPAVASSTTPSGE